MAAKKILVFACLVFLVAVVSVPAASAPGLPAVSPQDDSSYLQQLQTKRQEGWLAREVRNFRTFPHLDRAYRLMDAGRWPEAREELQKYLAINPKDLKARYNRLKDYAATIAQADRILKAQPTFVPAYLYRGLSRQALGQLDAALKDFQAAAAQPDIKKEDRVFALRMAADAALRLKQYQTAQAVLEQLLKLGGDFSLYYRQGLVLEGQGKLPAAEQSYRQALKAAASKPERLKALLSLGEVAKKRQDWPAARQALLAALELQPRAPEILRGLAEIAYARQDYGDSARWLRAAPGPRTRPPGPGISGQRARSPQRIPGHGPGIGAPGRKGPGPRGTPPPFPGPGLCLYQGRGL